MADGAQAVADGEAVGRTLEDQCVAGLDAGAGFQLGGDDA